MDGFSYVVPGRVSANPESISPNTVALWIPGAMPAHRPGMTTVVGMPIRGGNPVRGGSLTRRPSYPSPSWGGWREAPGGGDILCLEPPPDTSSLRSMCHPPHATRGGIKTRRTPAKIQAYPATFFLRQARCTAHVQPGGCDCISGEAISLAGFEGATVVSFGLRPGVCPWPGM